MSIKEVAYFLVKLALAEDVGRGDITTRAIVPKGQSARAVITAKEDGVIAGLAAAREVFKHVDHRIKFSPKVRDGKAVKKWTVIAVVSGPARGILTGERVALNFLQHLSGIATLTKKFVARVKTSTSSVESGQGARILDTRKTIPGMRLLEKYAVRMGGGENHRLGLYDAILIKDNHIKIARGVERAVEGIRRQYGAKKAVEIETKTINEVQRAIAVGVDRVLLDNLSVKTLRAAAKLCKKAKIKTEASGGVRLNNVAAIARTGVDYISIGALTHSAPALDISLKVV